MRRYDINWDRLVQDMLPAMLRKPRILALLGAFVSPVTVLHEQFLAFRQGIADVLPIGPEVRVLRHFLNERYDYSDRRIVILDGQDDEPLRIYTEDENLPIYLPVFLSAQSVDFTVVLPASIQVFEAEIRRFLNAYKLLTKTYRIIYV